jgi:hypothetical protein
VRKHQEMTNENSCMSKVRPNEMTFVLLARDSAAPSTIRYWVETRILQGKNKPDDPQILEALRCADIMAQEREIERTLLGLKPMKDQGV